MSAPPKRSAPGREIAGAAKLRLMQSYQQCSHSATVTERMPARHVHFAAERCAGCGRLIHWLSKPETVERRKINGYRLARLQMTPGLSAWERQFVDSLAKLPGNKYKFTPKQQSAFDDIYRRHFGEGRSS